MNTRVACYTTKSLRSHLKRKTDIYSRDDLITSYIKNYLTVIDVCYVVLHVLIWDCYDLAHAKNVMNFTRVAKTERP